MQGQRDQRLRAIIRLVLENPDTSEDEIHKALQAQGTTALITTVRNVRHIARLVIDEQHASPCEK